MKPLRPPASLAGGRRFESFRASFPTFMGAVIDRKSFDKIGSYLEDARRNATIIHGGGSRSFPVDEKDGAMVHGPYRHLIKRRSYRLTGRRSNRLGAKLLGVLG